jgi:hypothetical protein
LPQLNHIYNSLARIGHSKFKAFARAVEEFRVTLHGVYCDSGFLKPLVVAAPANQQVYLL